jgi:hypothetical protein
MGNASLNCFHAIEDDWFGASEALACAEAETIRALVEYRRNRCASTGARLAVAVQARELASLRLRELMQVVWDQPI